MHILLVGPATERHSLHCCRIFLSVKNLRPGGARIAWSSVRAGSFDPLSEHPYRARPKERCRRSITVESAARVGIRDRHPFVAQCQRAAVLVRDVAGNRESQSTPALGAVPWVRIPLNLIGF